MRTRTRLTTPPDQAPEADVVRRPADDQYVPAWDLPHEPRVPGRFRRAWLTLLTLVVFVPLAYGAFLLATAGESFDPSLDGDVPADVAEDPAIDGEADDPVVDPSG